MNGESEEEKRLQEEQREAFSEPGEAEKERASAREE